MELKEEKMLQMEETSGTEGQGAVSKPVTGTDQIITLDRLAASVYENDNETDDLNWHELQNSMLKQKILTGMLISMERKITDRNLDVEADIPEEPILVLGDKDMITQVIYNLLENATKFAREGSTLYLGVTTIDGKARVTVRNEGDTIPAEELPLLFERFHKSDKSRSEDKDGYGLGLYIVKTILEQHKEKISVTSEDGVTAFSFSLATE